MASPLCYRTRVHSGTFPAAKAVLSPGLVLTGALASTRWRCLMDQVGFTAESAVGDRPFARTRPATTTRLVAVRATVSRGRPRRELRGWRGPARSRPCPRSREGPRAWCGHD